MRHSVKFVVALVAAASAGTGHTQGIPVIDAANLAQAIQQAINGVTQITNQVEQIARMQRQLDSLNGIRKLGRILDDPHLRNYVPAEAYTVLNAVSSSGYSGLGATAKALRDAGMVYNCMDRPEARRSGCQSELARPYQYKGLLQDAMKAAAGRLSQIQALMAEVDATTDQKSIQEVQARIGAENAMLAHEVSQVQMLQGMADSEERIARSRDRERQYATLSRTGKVSDYLKHDD